MRTRILVAVVAVFLMGAGGDDYIFAPDIGCVLTLDPHSKVTQAIDATGKVWPVVYFGPPTTTWTDLTVKKMKGTEEVETGFGEIDWSRTPPEGSNFLYCKPHKEVVAAFDYYEIGLRSDGVVVWRECK